MKLREWLKENGYGEGANTWCSHTCGLPPTGNRVIPSYSPIDGAHTVVVTNTHVQSYVCRIPYNYSDWSAHGPARPYETPEQLKEILDEMIQEPKGCWS